MNAEKLPDTTRPRPWGRADLAAIAALVLGVVCVFGPLLLPGTTRVMSHSTGDTAQYFIPMRAFTADEIREGRLPLWNPHLMSGTPFIGNFQSAMFYPPNATYLVLPTHVAVNVDYALHLLLIAVFMYLWARGRGITVRGGLLSSAVVTFSASIYLRVMAGQVTMVDAMAWAPLLFYTIDRVFDRAARREALTGPVLTGTAAIGMQVLAGHPQTVFITGFTAGIYCALRFPGAEGRVRATAALLLLVIWGFALGCVQLLPGVETMNESLRAGGIDAFDFTTTFSFPPENLLNLIAPAFFGDRLHLAYWSRWAIWDAAAFIGVVGLTLALYGAKYANARQRRYAPLLVVLLVFLAMGRYSPVYSVFRVVPVLDALRGVSKFLFPATMFAGILCGLGFDRVLADAGSRRARRVAMALCAIVPVLLVGAAAIAVARFTGNGERWKEIVFRQMSDGLFSLSWFTYSDDYFRDTALLAMGSLGLAAIMLVLVSALLWNSVRSRKFVFALLAIGLVEMLAYAVAYRATFDESILDDDTASAWYRGHGGDYRTAQLSDPARVYHRNHPMRVGQQAVWGYEPVMLQRYGMFIAGACVNDLRLLPEILDHARWGSDIVQYALNSKSVDFHEDPTTGRVTLPAAFDLVRCRLVVVPEGLTHTQPGIYENPLAMPRFALLNDYVVLENTRTILQELNSPTFNPREKVLLEEAPNPAPNPAGGRPVGSVAIEDESTDHVTLRVTVDRPAILLMTDAISSGWRVTALDDSVQQAYDLLPANFALRGVPLQAGAHHFRMEYLPVGFQRGALISMVAAIAFAAAATYWAFAAAGNHLAKKAK